MSADSAPINLTGHFLIAMPGLQDRLFSRSVVYVCEHNRHGALGLVVNKPGDITLTQLFESVEMSLGRPELADAPVLRGGPVQTDRGFVLHEPVQGGPAPAEPAPESVGDAPAASSSADDARPPTVYASTLVVPGGLELTTSRDVLEAMVDGGGPRHVLVALGFAAWGEGQLESEIAENSWLTVLADPSVIFETPLHQRYDSALRLLGLQPGMLVSGAGHA